jgi:hypothetical protein
MLFAVMLAPLLTALFIRFGAARPERALCAYFRSRRFWQGITAL